MSNKLLTPRQLDLFMLLDGKGDVAIVDLYKGYYQRDPRVAGSVRRMQQQLGWVIGALNTRLSSDHRRIIPGRARSSYRLVDFPKL